MILASPRLMDLAFVARMLREHHLNSKPSGDPVWSESDRWKRVVEPHEWGAVVFVSDREANQHCTLVLIGKFDLSTGAVDDGNVVRRIVIPPWYADLARFFSGTADAGEVIEVPRCLGLHEPDHVCDGGVNPEGQTEPECQWRKRCIVFQDYAAKEDRAPDVLLAELAPSEVVALTKRLDQPAKKRPSVPKVNPVAYDIFANIYRKLSELLHPRPFRTSKSSARAGDVFFIDKVPTSGYLHIYVASESGRAIPLVGIRPKQIGGVDFQLPLPPDHPLLDPFREHVVPWRDGRFLSAFKRVPTRVSLEDACGVILRAVEDGEIELPPMPLIDEE